MEVKKIYINVAKKWENNSDLYLPPDKNLKPFLEQHKTQTKEETGKKKKQQCKCETGKD